MFPNRKTVLTIRSAVALALMLWCAGTGCMMVSYARAASNDGGESALWGHGMAGSMSADAHACCKAKHGVAKAHHQRTESKPSDRSAELNLMTLPSTPTQPGAMNCCPLTSGSMVVASRSQSNDRSIVSPQTLSSSWLLVTSDPSPLAIPLRLPNRAHSYLLDCAFLI